MAGLGEREPLNAERPNRRASLADRLSSWQAEEEQRLVEAEAEVRFWPWFCGSTAGGSHAHHFVLVSLFLMSLVMSIAGVILISVKSLHSSAIVLDVMVEWLDCISYLMAIICEYWCLNASPEKRRTYEFRTAVLSTLLLALTGAKSAYSAATELICSEDVTFSSTQQGDKPCAFLQLRPHPNMMIAVSLTVLLGYIPVMVVARFASAKDFAPEESVNKAAVLLHVVIDIINQLLVFLVSLGILWDPSYAVLADVVAAGLILLILMVSTSVLWYRYYRDE